MKIYQKYFIQIIYLFLIIHTIHNAGESNPSTDISSSSSSDSTLSSNKPSSSSNSHNNPPSSSKESSSSKSQTSSSKSQTSSSKSQISSSSSSSKTTPVISSGKEKKEISYNITERCYDTEPEKDIIEDCILGNKLEDVTGETCCYMTVKYKYNTLYACFPVYKDVKEIKKRIEVLKEIYVGNKSIKINCFTSFIKLTIISILLIFLYD